MTSPIFNPIRTIELAGWGFDEYRFRPESFDNEKTVTARELIFQRRLNHSANAMCEEESRRLRNTLDLQRSRLDLHTEMRDLDWFLGVVDLRRLLAFQRRVSFNATLPPMTVPSQCDWEHLIEIAFASPSSVTCDIIHDSEKKTLTLQSRNPNMQLRITQDPTAPVKVYTGSPFFEVARYAGRWFLRDGYHRAYTLLQAGIFQLPAVIVHAKTLEELGATQPQFFSEAILLSEHPPFVSDFLNEDLTIEYERHPIIKTLRITMEESISPLLPATISGEQL
jgi:hypothetical protein